MDSPFLKVPAHSCQVFISLKGQCHEMNNFAEDLKNQISTYCISASVFKFVCIFIVLIVKKNTFEGPACFYENTY
jgi:hypothetical protein